MVEIPQEKGIWEIKTKRYLKKKKTACPTELVIVTEKNRALPFLDFSKNKVCSTYEVNIFPVHSNL